MQMFWHELEMIWAETTSSFFKAKDIQCARKKYFRMDKLEVFRGARRRCRRPNGGWQSVKLLRRNK